LSALPCLHVLTTTKGDRHDRSGYPAIKALSSTLKLHKENGTAAKAKFIDHYQSILNLIDDLGSVLYPESAQKPTTNQEGKILMRILFSSCADTFETYMSDLLYEIYLANPATLKSGEQITVKEVLDCTDMQEFVDFYAKKKLAKLQRGSVKGFIADNHGSTRNWSDVIAKSCPPSASPTRAVGLWA
jgi:hypothetical protein